MVQSRTSVTIADVAKEAGVSRAAVSKVIRHAYGVSESMRAKVERAIDHLGYRPSVAARSLRGASYTLGIEVPSMLDHFLHPLIDGATTALEHSPYQVIIAPAEPNRDNGSPKAVQALADRRVDGIIAVAPSIPSAWLENMASQIPLVTIGRHDQSSNYDTIVNDDLLGSRLVVEHLHHLGHRDIVHVTQHPDVEGGMPGGPHAKRSKGYLDAMVARGLGGYARVVHVASTTDSTYTCTFGLLESATPPTAIFAGHDDLAMGVLRALTEKGMGAREVSVVGYDDTPMASHPLISLTTINQSAFDMGASAIRLLLERISGRTETVHEVMIPTLMARRSSAEARTAQTPT